MGHTCKSYGGMEDRWPIRHVSRRKMVPLLSVKIMTQERILEDPLILNRKLAERKKKNLGNSEMQKFGQSSLDISCRPFNFSCLKNWWNNIFCCKLCLHHCCFNNFERTADMSTGNLASSIPNSKISMRRGHLNSLYVPRSKRNVNMSYTSADKKIIKPLVNLNPRQSLSENLKDNFY